MRPKELGEFKFLVPDPLITIWRFLHYRTREYLNNRSNQDVAATQIELTKPTLQLIRPHHNPQFQSRIAFSSWSPHHTRCFHYPTTQVLHLVEARRVARPILSAISRVLHKPEQPCLASSRCSVCKTQIQRSVPDYQYSNV